MFACRIEGLDTCMQLRKLNLSFNKIKRVENIWHLTKLECLYLQGNVLDRVHVLDLQNMAQLSALKVLYLQSLDRSKTNPCCSAPDYKAVVLKALPGLTNLDGER